MADERESRQSDELRTDPDAEREAEARREARKEEHPVPGDQVRENRTLEGASTWLTLEENEKREKEEK